VDTNKLLIVPEQTAINFLTRFKPMSLGRILWVLSQFRTMNAIYVVFKEFYPGKVNQILGKPRDWFSLGFLEPEKIDARFSNALGTLFPIDESFTDELLFVDYASGDFGGFRVQCVGPCLSWDGIEEIFQDVPSTQGWLSLPLFFGAICNDFEEDQWKLLAKQFHWPYRTRPPLPEGSWYIDDDIFEGLLRKNHMKKYFTAWKVCAEDTGLPFFDDNPYDESSYPQVIEAKAENIRELTNIWRQKGQPMYLEYTQALEEVQDSPRVLKKLFDLMMQAHVMRPEETEKENGNNNEDVDD
jgi:hypothetical protein